MKMTGNTVLIIGGTSGIGRALAEALHDRGNRVIVTGRRQAMLDQITASRPAIAGLRLDLLDPVSLVRLTDTIRTRFAELNVLIANAGVSQAEDLTSDSWNGADAEAIVATNILGVLRTVAAFLPLLKGQRESTIVATSSALAFVPLASFPTYCASKAFLHSWLTSLRHQLRRTGVEVLELSPPYVQTELTGAEQAKDPRAMPVDDYVAQVMHMLEQGNHPLGELLLERDHARRWAERDGAYDTIFSAMNPD
jgi:uncharacterized oxidoreductase